MKQNFKRFLSWTLALLMTLSLLPAGLLSVPAHAEELPAEREQEQEQEQEQILLGAGVKITVLFQEAENGYYSIEVDSTQKSTSGQSVTFTPDVASGKEYKLLNATPDAGYRFAGWYYVVDSEMASAPFSTEETAVLTPKESCTVTARFELEEANPEADPFSAVVSQPLPDGVHITFDNSDVIYPWALSTEADGKAYIKSGNMGIKNTESSLTVKVHVPDDGKHYAFQAEYMVNYGTLEVTSNGRLVDKKEYTKYGAEFNDLPVYSKDIPLQAGENAILFKVTIGYAWESFHAGWIRKLSVAEVNETSFSVEFPEDISVTYSINGADAQPLTSGAAVTAVEKDTITVTATAPGEGYYFQGWFDKAGNLCTAVTSYTFLVDGDAAQNKLFVKKIAEGFEGEVEGYTAPENLTVTTEGQYPWGYTSSKDGSGALFSGNRDVKNTSSILTVTPAKDGVLCFEYKTSLDSQDFLYYRLGDKGTSVYDSLNRGKFKGVCDWTKLEVAVKANEPVYFFLYKSGWSSDCGEDTAWLRNLSLDTEREICRIQLDFGAKCGKVSLFNKQLSLDTTEFLAYKGVAYEFKAEWEVPYTFDGWLDMEGNPLTELQVTDTSSPGQHFSFSSTYNYTPTSDGYLIVGFNSNPFRSIAGYDLTDTGIALVESRSDLPWVVGTDDLANALVCRDNTTSYDLHVSTMCITAAVDGTLSFEYMTASPAGSYNYPPAGGIKYKNGTELTAKNTCVFDQAIYKNIADNQSSFEDFRGNKPWTTHAIENVKKGDKIYIAYCWKSDPAISNPYVALRNLKIVGGDVTVTAVANNEAYGTVTGNIGKVAAGTTVTLAATPAEGCGFYGWQVDGKTVSMDKAYTFYAADDITVTANFAPAGTYLARIGMTFYPTLEAAFSAAENGESKTVILLEDTAISEDLTIPAGVTLVVPFSASDETGYQEGTAACARPTIATRAAFRKLTVAAGKTLTVNGTLVVGGVQHAPDQNAQGQTSGDYAEIVCNGTVQVAAGGTLTVYGKITGSGTTRVVNGATAKIPYLVTDYAGGTNTEALYNAKSFPFGQYATINVQNTMVVEGGASVIGMTSLYFWSSITTQEVDLIGTDSGLIYLPVGSTLTATYDTDKAVKTTVGNIDLQDFGKTTLTISGGAAGGKFDLSGYGSTGMYLNIPYTYDLVLTNGSYSMTNLYRIMPGAVVTVASDAQLNVAGGLQVADGWQQADKSGKSYPASDVLAANGFSQSGNLIVDGTLNITGTFGGIAQTTGGGVITTGADAKLNESFTSGSTDGYTDNLVSYSLPARLMMGDALTQMTAGSKYYAAGSDGWTLESYTMQANRINTGDTVTINQSMQGKWQGKISVTLTFDPDGGSAIEPITAQPGDAITLPTPVRPGYTFAGWYNGEEKFEATTMPAQSLTLKAHWTISQYTITFDTDGGSVIAPITQDYGTAITAPEDPTKAGYRFDGWDQTIPATMPAENVTVKATWTANTYMVSFDANGGSCTTASKSVTYASTYGDLPTPTREGYTFTGWYDGETKVEDTTTYQTAGDKTLTARWSADAYTVTYYVDNSKVTEQGYTYGASITPYVFQKSGYTVSAWKQSDGSALPVAMPAKNLSVYATTAIITYTISYELNGGTNAAGNPASYTVETDTITLGDPSKTGYTFNGWSGTELNGENNMTAVIAKGSTGDRSYQAHWTVNQYTITFDTDGGSKIAPITQDYGTAITVPADPIKAGYRFDGWDQTIPATMPAENVTVKARWTSYLDLINAFADFEGEHLEIARGYYSKLSAAQKNAGSEKLTALIAAIRTDAVTKLKAEIAGKVGAANELLIQDGESIAKVAITGDQVEVRLIDEDYPARNLVNVSFLTTLFGDHKTMTVKVGSQEATGMNQMAIMVAVAYEAGVTSSSAAISALDGKQMPVVLTDTTDGDIQYSVTYQLFFFNNTHTLTWNTNGGQSTTTTGTYGQPIEAPPVSRMGYTFAGWVPQIPAAMGKTALTFTAQWTANTYTITFDANGGSCTTASKSVTYASTYGDLPVPTREGYGFDGWFTAQNDGTKVTGNDTVTITAGQTLYAHWKPGAYTITFDTDGGSAIDPITQDYGTKITAPAAPTKTGYTFNGWNPAIPETMPAENVTVKAQWTIDQYTISFDTDGGSEIEPITQNYGTAITAPTDPTKVGYTFAGWELAIPETMPAENRTVKAKWTANQYTITFDTDGGSAIDPITQDYGAKITAPAAPTKTGYTFNGWNPAIPETMPAENVTVKATWKANTYTVHFDTNGGSACADITVTFGQTYGTLPTPEKAGYTFAGWYAGETPVTAETMVEITADQTLTAHWNAKGNTPYTVEYYQQNLADNDYTMVKKESLSGQTDSTVEAEIVNYTGFTVNNEKSTTSGTVAGDGGLVLKVYYDRNTYQITWVVDGRETSATYRFGVTPTAPAAEKAADNSGSYTFTGWDKTPAPVTEHARYTAQFRKKYDAVIGETTYRTVALALEAAKTGETVTVQDGAIITESTQVPVGVLLLVPCMADDTGYSQRAGSEYYNPNGTAVEPALGANGTRYCTLTVAEGAALTVHGTLLVNAVTGRPQAGHLDQDINGGYGELQLNGTITVEQGGIFDSCGYTKGNGRITANAGGTVRDLYVVRSWRGGAHALVMYEEKIYPMNEYDMHNITAPIRIYAGAVLEGTVKMYALDMFSYTRFMQIGESNGLIRLAEGAYADRTYDAESGRVCYTLSGGADFSSSKMEISVKEVSTENYYFPVDGDIDLVLEKGAYSINNDLKLLTGSTLTVNGDAALTVEAGANLIAYQQFHDPKNTGDTQYPERPAAKILLKNGAVWTVNGGFAGKLTLDAAEGSRAVVTLAADAATELSSREANGYQKDRTDPCYQEIKECAVMEENTALTAGMQYSFVRRNGKVCAENRFEAVESSGAFRLLASAADGSQVIAAGYDAQGKMTGVSVLVLSAPSMSGTVTLPKGSWTQLRYFLLSPENAPVCEMCSCAR